MPMNIRSIAVVVLMSLCLLFCIIGAATDIVKVTVSAGGASRSSTSKLFDELSAGTSDDIAGLVKAGRAFIILTILGSLPPIVLAVVDLLGKAMVAVKPFKFVLAGACGIAVFTGIIGWPICMAIAGKIGSKGGVQTVDTSFGTFTIETKIDASPAVGCFMFLVGWVFACAAIPTSIFAPAATDTPVTVNPSGSTTAAAAPWLPTSTSHQQKQPQKKDGIDNFL
jgi:hypothetical protein